jgi:hypothetical protein
MQREATMKKYAVVCIALLLLASVAGAGDPKKFIAGEYEMTASGSCIHSSTGFNSTTLKANPDGIVYAGTTAWIGTWKFKPDGTGSYSDTFYATVTPPPSPTTILGGIRSFSDENVPFTYIIDGSGDITINDGTIEYTGRVTADRKNIILLDTPTIQGPYQAPFWYLICNTARNLVKVGD